MREIARLPILKIISLKYLALAPFILILLLPIVTANIYLITFLTFAGIWAIFAASLDLVAAYTNQINLGHAVFFGTGAYVAAFLNLWFGLSPWLTLFLGAIAAMVVGLILGVLCLRVRGPYLLLTTAMANFVLIHLVYSFSDITGGEDGLIGIKRLFVSPEANYCFSSFLMLASIIILIVLVKSRIGMAFKTVRDDEIAAEAIGVNVVNYKLIAFTISGFFAGLAGSFYAHYLGFVGTSTLSFDLTFMAFTMAIVGGWGTIIGPLVGAYLLTTLNEYLRFIGGYRTLIWGIVVILVILFMRGGILRSAIALSRKLRVRIRGSLRI